MTVCRLLVDPPAAGAWNMAVDEVILESAAEGQATLRFYQWSEATLSIGYFQRRLDRQKHTASLACPIVRRASGGGAIVHDRELTYAFALPAGHALARDPKSLYCAVHGALAEVLCPPHSGHAVSLCEVAARHDPEPFLCFQRCGNGDLQVNGFKIAGSAQRRRQGAIVQHGSVLLGTSPAAPELPGWEELTGRRLDPDALTAGWSAMLESRLGLELQMGGLNPVEQTRADQLMKIKYATSRWAGRK